LGVNDEPGTVQRLGSIALDAESRVSRVPTLVVDYSDYREKVKKAQFEGILGATYLEHLKITVDYQRDLLYIRDN